MYGWILLIKEVVSSFKAFKTEAWDVEDQYHTILDWQVQEKIFVGVHFSSRQIQTQGGWLLSGNPTTVLCRPPAFTDKMIIGINPWKHPMSNWTSMYGFWH